MFKYETETSLSMSEKHLQLRVSKMVQKLMRSTNLAENKKQEEVYSNAKCERKVWKTSES